MMKKKYVLYLLLILLLVLLKGTVYLDISVEELKKKYANKESKFIQVDDLKVHYRDEGKGIPIVLLHGTGASLQTWNDWASTLKENFRVIRMDLPAFGLTGTNNAKNYSIQFYTTFLNKFLKKIDIEKFYLVGNSLGGNIAWNYAAKNPEQIYKLTLIAASGLPTEKPKPWIFKVAKIPVLRSMFLYLTPRAVIKNNLEQVYFDDTKISDNLVTRYHELTLRKGNRKAFIDRAKIENKLDKKASFNQLKNLKIETLLLWGEFDYWIPLQVGVKMDSLIPNSKLVVLPNSGHIPMEENPVESVQIFTGFINN